VEWLAALPDRVEELTERWGLDLGEPFEPGGNCSWVAPGTDCEGREVVCRRPLVGGLEYGHRTDGRNR